MFRGWYRFFPFGFARFGWIGAVIHLLISALIVIGIILLVIWLVRRLSHAGPMGPGINPVGPLSPREILQMRYARGEITREQYKQMLEDLSG